MSKMKLFSRRSPNRAAIPSGLKPFPFVTARNGLPEAPSSDGDARDEALSVIPSADWVPPSVPGYAMPAIDVERRIWLRYLIGRFQAGEAVKKQDIKLAVTADEWRQYETALHEPRNRVVPRRVSSRLKEYNALLRKADKLSQKVANGSYGRSRSLKRSRLGPVRPRSFDKEAESLYERAINLLADLLHSNPEIAAYLDRPVRFGQIEGTATLEPEGVPRLITSRSQYARYEDKPKKTRRSLIFSTLEASLQALNEKGRAVQHKGSGIGDAPVIPGTKDQWIFAYGEWRVV